MALYGLEHSELFWEKALDTKLLLAWNRRTILLAFRGHRLPGQCPRRPAGMHTLSGTSSGTVFFSSHKVGIAPRSKTPGHNCIMQYVFKPQPLQTLSSACVQAVVRGGTLPSGADGAGARWRTAASSRAGRATAST